jgi:uncharacterized protein YjlB
VRRRGAGRSDKATPDPAHTEAVVAAAAAGLDAAFEELFNHNGWPAAWRNGIYPFHNFHCGAHEGDRIFKHPFCISPNVSPPHGGVN